MNCFRCLMLLMLIGMMAAYGCGKKKEPVKDEDTTTKQVVQQDIVTDEEIPFQEMLEGAGFEVLVFKKFPAQEQGIKGRILVYSGKKNDSGGVIFCKKTGSLISPAWHWYFDKSTIDSVNAVEINEDGLWDIRITDSGNRVHTFIQEETFTLSAKPREDFLALNGTSIPAALPDHPLWMCFDGNAETSWQTTLDGKTGARLEFDVPFGVGEGILTIETSATGQPKECDVYAGGKRIEQLKFERKSGRQLFRLAESIRGAKKVSIVFTAGYDSQGVVSVAELALK